MSSNRTSRNLPFSWIRSSKSTDSDISADDIQDDFLDSDHSDDDEGNNNTAEGLEMESFTPASPRTSTKRSDSNGSITLRRNNNHYGSATSPCTQRRVYSRGASTSSGDAGGGPCDSNSRRIAQVGQMAARRVFGNTRNRRVSIWLLVLLLMVLASVSMNVFEGSYIVDLFGTEQGQESKVAPALQGGSGVPLKTGNDYDSSAAATPLRQTAPHPTMAPITPQPFLSVHEHKERVQNQTYNSSADSRNTFTTWLDFDDQDPPKASKFPSIRKDGGKAFCDRWCDLRGTTWYPESNQTQWQRRAPSFLLPGALCSGTVYMAAALHRHPNIVPARTKELQFFYERPFRRYVSAQGKTLVKLARERMYAGHYNTSALKQNEQWISFDATPGYLFYSSLLPQRILCVEPWVQLVLLLRNPVDRVLEHYSIMRDQRGLKLTLEEWIDKDFALMEKIGLIPPANSTNDKFYGSTEEDVAWYDYQTASLGSGALGRSMYVVQIRQWVQELRAIGRRPNSSMLIVRTDHVAVDPAAEYRRILRFLKLPLVPLHDSKSLPPLTVTHQTRTVDPATRQRLEDFYRPYNRRLKGLLRQYGISSSVQDDAV